MTAHTLDQERVYRELVTLYDYAEKLVDAVEQHMKDVDASLDIVEPLIDKLSDTADVLTELYRELVDEGKEPDAEQQEMIKEMLEHLYTAIGDCKSNILQVG